ncbi:probable WRKY transcription factor protein 1, partial [Musca vetustissima]|uniref:probable WRKY transcription factor protein 1 n=1 Tax=Musca vetustissima TaxID=27455 RepID=UPI002AB60F1A
MSFFRNLRSSITRGRSSSRDTTPVRTSRPGSVISGLSSNKRRDSVESGADPVLNRSGTFILDDEQQQQNENSGHHSNTSTLEKKSKKSKVLEKFSTFTKRKKTPTPDSSALDHHPSDNATNTYYKWQADGSNSLDYDSQTDPFNFLYDQTSLKSLHNGGSTSNGSTAMGQTSGNERGSNNTPSYGNKTTNGTFDSSTYRKGKMPKELKKQLEQLKQSQNLPENDVKDNNEEDEDDYRKYSGFENLNEADKYKTVTINSFRKSFRDKFLQQQKEAPHNPAWFVEVEPPEDNSQKNHRERSLSKENRTDFLVFENDNYRPGSRSPIRDLSSRRQQQRSATRSPVKRTDTFKVERSTTNSRKTDDNSSTPSIRIEFRNSITPHVPGRMVPVGVAKPMPSQTAQYNRIEPIMNTSYTIKTSNTRLNGSPQRNWSKTPQSRSPSRPTLTTTTTTTTGGRYQTLVQIKNDNSNIGGSKLQQPVALTTRPSRLSTRIQLGGNTGIPTSNSSPSFAKRYVSSYSTQVNGKAQPLRQTYFGDNHHYNNNNSNNSPLTSKRTLQSPVYRGYVGHKNASTTTTPVYNSKYQTSNVAAAATTTNLATSRTPSQSRSTSSHAPATGGGGITSSSYSKQHQNHQTRFVVPTQRRSRSPIKIPWR